MSAEWPHLRAPVTTTAIEAIHGPQVSRYYALVEWFPEGDIDTSVWRNDAGRLALVWRNEEGDVGWADNEAQVMEEATKILQAQDWEPSQSGWQQVGFSWRVAVARIKSDPGPGSMPPPGVPDGPQAGAVG